MQRKFKQTKAQHMAEVRWRNKHRTKARRNSYLSSGKAFIRHYSTPSDLDNLLKLISDNRKSAEFRAKKKILYS